MTLSVPAGSLLHHPDGTPFLPGDSVEITVSLDSTQIAVGLAPGGLVFNDLLPARLAIWYSGSNPDFNGDGLVDFADAYIEEALLGLWVREQANDPWITIDAIKSLLSRQFSADLHHFSQYAVSW